MDTIPLDPLRAIALVAAGFVAGVMNSVAGGGTLVTFPTLIFVGIPSIPANATSTVALLPAAIASAAAYRRRIPAVARWLRVFAPVSLLGGFLGGYLLVQTPAAIFDWFVPFLILFATLLFMGGSTLSRMIGTGEALAKATSPSPRWIAGGVLFQLCVAVYGGYFGAGIGILMLASLALQGFHDVHEMNALKVLLGFLINVVAATYFIATGLIHWVSAIIMMAGTVLGGYAGAHAAQKFPQKKVRRVITAIGLIISAVMFFKQLS